MYYDLFDYSDRVAGENGTPFTELPYMHTLCEALEQCVMGTLPDGKKNLLITIPPRHYKTTFTSQNFVAWCLAEIAPDCEFILTSYSSGLSTMNSMAVKKILNSDWHRAMYPDTRLDKKGPDLQSWFRTSQGGCVYAVGMQGSITGFGAGKTRKGFGGAIIIDDPMKAADVRSDVQRMNSIGYYLGTLKSRRNNAANTPIIIIMQRLHVEDLAGWVLKNEPGEWHSIVFPAIQDGVLLNPITTTVKELELMKVIDPMTYYAQYQQSPQVPGGNMIKLDWWRLYDPTKEIPHGLRYITADTGFKEKDNNDQSVMQCWEATEQGLFFVDSMYGRWDFPKLLNNAQFFYERCGKPREFWIEDKASGTPLEQMMSDTGLPAFAWKPSAFGFPDDKVGRMQSASWFVHGGKVYLPMGNVPVTIGEGQTVYLTPGAAALMEEAASFSRDMSHAHDDHCFVAGTRIATLFGDKPIEQIKKGDLIITPLGIRQCLESGKTGEKVTIKKFGLKCTPEHKVFNHGVFTPIEKIDSSYGLSYLTIKELLKWTYQKQLYSMVKNTRSWEREDIICISQQQMQKEKKQKDSMLQYGNILAERKFQKAILFTIKTVIAIIMTLTIWSVFHAGNTIKSIVSELMHRKNKHKICRCLQENGTSLMRVLLGIKNKVKNSQNHQNARYAHVAEKVLIQKEVTLSVQESVQTKAVDVYNLKVENAGCYYANGVLVSNCDAFTMAVSLYKDAGGQAQ